MLRKRSPPMGTLRVSAEDELSHKYLAKGKKANHVSLRVLVSTLFAAVLAAINPLPDVRSQAYSKFFPPPRFTYLPGLSEWVCILTKNILVPLSFALSHKTYGLAFNTFVVQLFWTISLSSVLLYFFGRNTWLRLRESICVWANVAYGIVTVLKIFHLVDRLPNENHYMFKHCFLTMADAAFSQTPVHKQYVVQFAEAVIRVIVWRRYNVLADTPTWGIITISLAWQLWLVTFSSMLQARHVSAFRSQRQNVDAANDSGRAAPSHTTARSSTPTSPTTTAAASADRPDSCEIEPSGESNVQEDRPKVTPSVKNPQSRINNAAAVSADAQAAAAAAATDVAIRVSSERRTAGMPSASGPLRRSSIAGSSSSSPSSTVSHKLFMRALRSVARGPSSYVLLSHQRRQAGGPQCSSAQFYIPAAKPEMLSGNWREKLASAIAEGAPGWHVANICVRKGSLIVHLDLVYAPTTSGGGEGGVGGPAATAAATAGMGVASLAGGGIDAAAPGDVGFPGASYSEQPFGATDGHHPMAVLNDFMDGMGAESLLQLLGLPPDLPAGPAKPISIQLGDQIKTLPSSASDAVPVGTCAAASFDTTTSTITATSIASMASEIEPDAAAAPSPAKPPKEEATAATADLVATAGPPAWPRLFSEPLRTALFPPTELYSPEYCRFLSERVGALHRAYAAFICLTAMALFVVRSDSHVNPVTLMLFISTELLSLSGYAAIGGAAWRTVRCRLVYVGVVLRTLQMAACTSGVLPHVLKVMCLQEDTDCISGRWIQKVVLITTLQALCIQPPVRTFFVVRFPSVVMSIYVHVFVCRTSSALRDAMVLHLGWEGLLFLISANFQLRHLEAFRSHRRHSNSSSGGCCQREEEKKAVAATAASEGGQETESRAVALIPCSRCCAVGGDAKDAADETIRANGTTATGSTLPAEDVKHASATAAAPVAAAFGSAADISDPCDVSLSAPLVVMAPRRAAHLQLHFTCAPAIMGELQVVLRHINPAAMSSGVHVAHAVRDITRTLVAPAGATAAPPHMPTSFSADLTLVASPADMPGLVHIEVWRGRRRICSHPVLLAAAAAPEASSEAVDGGASGAATSNWIEDVRRYVNDLKGQGHIAAADQFLVELGTWLAQAAALERGLTDAGNAGGGAGVKRVANVLYFHGYGSEFMYVKPRPVSGCGSRDASVGGGRAPALDPLQETLRQLLLCQGSMLLAVAVEAGCVALSEHLMGMLVGEMGATLRGLLEGARTPVTQLPLLHAAVKSSDARMVDLVAEWSTSCGLKDIWAHEAAVLAVSSASCASSTVGDTASLAAAGAAAAEAAVAQPASSGVAPALRRSSRVSLPQLSQDGVRRTTSLAFEMRPGCTAAKAAAPAVISGAAVAAGMDTTAAAPDSEDVVIADVDLDLESDFDVGDKDISEKSPFRIIDFRANHRQTAASSAAPSSQGSGVAAITNLAVGDLPRGNAATGGAAVTAGSGGGESTGGLGRGSSLDGLVGGGVLVLTPLHISLALGDEGRLASHILRTYPEAYELWRSSQLGVDVDPSLTLIAADPSRVEISASASASVSAADLRILPPPATGAASARPPGGLPLAATGSASSTSSVWRNVAGAAPAYSSMPGLAGLAKAAGTGHGGMGLGMGADDSMDDGSVQSLSLSEVAFFEGIRWVDGGGTTAARRPGFKVTRL
ncbi:hypothetical protein VOLCADRAFT_90779 [Volvox carteri f. nagariensis]|uniref:Uncharacterized protein n=1 Tax=Volvox carteri f. nagariensis TaxID=3068 RepID=D8TV12_VOLCA|nr:uncharacterized protein VOLCADRAFT_90779 [Volvox carteri f. nagariensis]EFJ48496.1 hypothetical protein VOLCADRAFT_90779 [Volvox carteri f. nagariensis]|eukprot:XP_002950295.1 hypothetical protein VOLCADRAFT_90779 [Volvox carteri f. nagariensis]